MKIPQDVLPAVLVPLVVMLPILAVLLLTGCVSQAISPNCPPPAPRLDWRPAADGGVCVSGESTADLLDYLDALEQCPG